MKTAVVYFSRKGYVKRVAEEIAKREDADVFEITTPERTNGFLGFWWCGRFGMHRWKMPIDLPEIDYAAYERFVVCSPVWVFTVCAPIREFLFRVRGKLACVDYALVHFSFPMKYRKTLAEMDRLCGTKHARFISVACQWGRFFRYRVFP